MEELRFFHREDPEHATASAALPWYLNGTLSLAEHTAVERHLAHCVQCSHDLTELTKLRRTVMAEEEDIPLERALAETARRIDRLEHGARRPTAWRRAIKRWLSAHARLSQPAMAAASFAALALSVYVLFTPVNGPVNGYKTLSAKPAPRVATLAMRVVFERAASSSQMRNLLVELDAEIVRGPRADGSYVISFPGGEIRELESTLAGSGIVAQFSILADDAQ